MTKRVRVEVKGRVQGVGFRPTVYRYASEFGLGGSVKNSSRGVVIDVEGDAGGVDGFLARLRGSPPQQARIDALHVEELPLAGASGFQIERSERSASASAQMPADLATCDDCLAEISNPNERRHGYAFTNCTNCGPRFTIIDSLPYDREGTSMASFQMCARCRAEYENPADRRFDAQPVACPTCGPALRLFRADGVAVDGDPLEETSHLLRSGAIVAIKGLGGFHLCCSASDTYAVTTLRERKARPSKALAVMFSSLGEIEHYCVVDEQEAEELQSAARPIVILRARSDAGMSALISPDTDDIGAFLPYTPLHHLLLERISPLVMTSANRSEEPIARNVEELKGLIGTVADYVFDHNRPILRRCDDSVLRIVGGRTMFIRRSRGFVPNRIPLPVSGPPVLACGADLKNVFAVARDGQAFLSQHIGDLEDYAALEFHRDAIQDWLRLFEVNPSIVAHDSHPDYHSTRHALRLPGRKLPVQHHHAHIAACMVENGLTGSVIGVALDGTGYGTDGSVWGGEVLVADYRQFRRAAHFRQYPMPGGEAAIRHPARMALGVLMTAEPSAMTLLDSALTPEEKEMLPEMVRKRINTPITSSAGRLFDAVGALLGFHEPVTYEGQAAVRLEALALRSTEMPAPYPYDISGHTPAVLDFNPMLRCILSDLKTAVDRSLIALRFHRTLAEAIAQTCARIRDIERLDRVALSGGVFQNILLLSMLTDALVSLGFAVFSHHSVPPNDGGIALGQAAIATALAEDE